LIETGGKAMSLAVTPRFIRKARPICLRVVAILTIAALLYTKPLWEDPSPIHESLEILGFLLLMAGVAGRLWCTLYIAGKKSRQLVTGGPYALCRNPLYLFSFLLVAGVILLFQNIIVFLLLGVFFPAFHLLAIDREERNLAGVFGNDYLAYCRRVPRLLPALRNWRAAFDLQGLAVSPRHLARTVTDCAGYLLALPLANLLELWYRNGVLPLG
jgi:protein-S-isoprenylcysteine O-methyltransferase Ste14